MLFYCINCAIFDRLNLMRRRNLITEALRETTGIRVNLYDLSANARRILYFYSFMFKFPPVVAVLRVPERQINEPYAQVTSAVRGLADDFGLRGLLTDRRIVSSRIIVNKQRDKDNG
jgi:hypothetical protein